MSLHQIAHGGDLHLGPNARNVDRRRVFEAFVDAGLALPRLSLWALPGDLNHARMAIDDRNWLASQLLRMGDVAPVVGCYGNHDLPGDLDIFEKMRTRWPIWFFKRPQVFRLQLATGADASIFVLPYPTEAGLVSAGVAPGDLLPRAYDALRAIFLGYPLDHRRGRERLRLSPHGSRVGARDS